MCFVLWFLVAAFGAVAGGVESDAAEWAAVEAEEARELLCGSIDTAGEGETDDVQFVLQKVVNNLYHALDGHGLLRDDQATFGVGLAEFGMEGRAAHLVLRCAMAKTGFVIDIEDRRQERVVVTENKGMVEVLENGPCGLLDFVTGVRHVDARIDGFLHLNGQVAGVTVQVLRLALESVETVGVLEV